MTPTPASPFALHGRNRNVIVDILLDRPADLAADSGVARGNDVAPSSRQVPSTR